MRAASLLLVENPEALVRLDTKYERAVHVETASGHRIRPSRVVKAEPPDMRMVVGEWHGSVYVFNRGVCTDSFYCFPDYMEPCVVPLRVHNLLVSFETDVIVATTESLAKICIIHLRGDPPTRALLHASSGQHRFHKTRALARREDPGLLNCNQKHRAHEHVDRGVHILDVLSKCRPPALWVR